MRYLDSGARDPASALGYWLDSELPAATGLRLQSGFYGGEVNVLLAPTLIRLREAGGPVWIVVGSNDQFTIADHVAALATLVGVPREDAGLAVASYAGGYFHPKVYHIVREDGSACAYVGSANLTLSGVGGRHVEAGVLLDSREGDDTDTLDLIGQAVEDWFGKQRPGAHVVDGAASVEELLESGVLRVQLPPPKTRPGGKMETEGAEGLVRLKLLFKLPDFPKDDELQDEDGDEGPTDEQATPESRPVTTRTGLPGYILMAEGLTTPTADAAALTGVPLPGGAVGLILQLNRDSARHFFGGAGTSNISIPVATLSTIRFGEYRGKYIRPRAEYSIMYRYLGEGGVIAVGQASTNIMAYGFAPGEVGHGDVRMLVPAGVKVIAEEVEGLGLKPPTEGDPALLEWPSDVHPEFRLTYLDPGSEVAESLRERLAAARAKGHLVGDGAAWMMPHDATPW